MNNDDIQKEIDKLKIEISILDTKQKALKILMNSDL
jgi:hypothetical protein